MSKYYTCLIPAEMVEEFADWQECAAFRIVPHKDPGEDAVTFDDELVGSVLLEVTNDLDLVTDPDAS
jgi:hypothetical protein